MTAIGTLAEAVLKLSVDGAKLVSGLNDAESKSRAGVERLKNTLDGVRNVAAIAFGAAALAIKSFATEAMGAEGSVKRLEATLRGLGPTVKQSSQEIQDWAAGLMRASDFDDEEIVDGFRKLVAMTGNAEQAMLGMEAATNLANSAGMDLSSGVNALVSGYAGMTRTLKTTFGVVLPEGVKGFEVIRQTMKRVDGQNELTADSTERAWRRMIVSWGNAKEALGTSLLPMIQSVSSWLAAHADRISKMDSEQQRAYASAMMWGAGLSALLVVGANVTKWAIELRAALATLAAAQAASNAQGTGMLLWMRSLPVAAAAAVVAIGAVIAAMDKLAKKHDQSFNNNQANHPTIMTSDGPKTPAEIANETRNDYQTKSALHEGDRTNSWLPFANWWIAASDALTGKSEAEAETASQVAAAQYQAKVARQRKRGEGYSGGTFLPPTAGEVYFPSNADEFRQGSRFGAAY